MQTSAIERLAAALKKGEAPDDAQPWDIAAATRLIADQLAIPGATVDAGQLRLAARALNASRHFEHTPVLAQAWRDVRGFDPTLAKHHAQALIELGALDQAEALLHEALALSRADAASLQALSEIPEYEGLLGRIDKQRFVASGDLDALARSSARYSAHYESNPKKPYWHGINVVALRARAEREGLPAGSGSAAELAAAIYGQVTALYPKNPNDQWLAATASEASLALDDCEQAELWLYRFLHHPMVKPFEVESYHRQLREIWQGSASAGGSACAERLAAIVSRHIVRTQRCWSVQASAVPAMEKAIERDAGGFEKNFLGEASFSVDMVKRMLAACAAIGCVTNRSGERLGTGFLIEGERLREAFGPAPVFVTNAHVISQTVPRAIAINDARVMFEVESAAAENPIFYSVGELLFTSEPGDLGVVHPAGDKLDITVVRLQGLDAARACLPTASSLPLINAKAKAYVVGHPRGSGLQISLHDSLLLDIDDHERLIHYRTPTDPGNSGSPVFNAQWEVIGLHHGGSGKCPRLHGEGTYEANEAIALGTVRGKLV